MIATLLCTAWAFGLSAQPYVVVETAPGSVVGRTLSVKNTATGPVEVRVYLGDWWFEGESHQFLPVGSHERSAAVFSTITPKVLRLAPEERREVELQMVVPADARGGRYAAVFFEVGGGGSVGTGMRMTTLVTLDIGGVETPTMAVTEISAKVAEALPSVSVGASHTGETHSFCRVKGIAREEGSMRIMRVDGPEWRFLPGQKRTLTVTFDEAFEPGIYLFDGVLACSNAAPTPVATRFAVP